jgi:hypothetical protein
MSENKDYVLMLTVDYPLYDCNSRHEGMGSVCTGSKRYQKARHLNLKRSDVGDKKESAQPSQTLCPQHGTATRSDDVRDICDNK